MEMPEVTKFLGMFPLKYGCFLISVFGLGFGGTLLAGIILYGIAENIIMHYFGDPQIDQNTRKAVLMPLGISALLMLLANTLLFFGISLTRGTYVAVSVRVMLTMCILLLLMAVSAPLSCFFMDNACLMKDSSLLFMLCGFLIMTLFIEVWLYNATVCWNLEQTMVY